MNVFAQKYGLLFLRLSLGWYFAVAGISKIINSQWSAAGYLTHATTFNGFYSWLASPSVLPITNFVNEWGLLLVGISLLLGIGVRWTGLLGAAMMILYAFPVLDFPKAGDHGFIFDEHWIYAAALLLLSAQCAENASWFKKLVSK